METKNIEFTPQNKIHITLNSLIVFVEVAMLISILIFSFFILKGFIILGHIPFYGDKEVISYNGFERIVAMIMLYPMFYGILSWTFLTVCGFLSSYRRKNKELLIGLILCLLNVLIMFSSQFEWIID
ncbi:hypothetical protein [Flavobacterium sp.]|uniref:hypothetical protein n=1 Tax=Flavobacterium sp. TaxID=239 RepID=UPI00391C3F41